MEKNCLSDIIVGHITHFINEKRESQILKTKFPNQLLREDVLDLLDMYCTVIYYPLENESNNGFHITGIPHKNGEEQHFVYINTSQTIEKQIFTAAHELGHIWEVDSYVLEHLSDENTLVSNEEIINRFAAELLMPCDQFLLFFNNELEKLLATSKKISITDLLKLIASIMAHFFVPQKAVIYRLFELNKISCKLLELLCGERDISEQDISEYIKSIMEENGHEKFIIPTQKKWINGLPEILTTAEQNKSISKTKTEELRKIFELQKTHTENDVLFTTDIMSEVMDIPSLEGDK